MAGIVRKLFKTAGGGSSRKKREEQFEEDIDDEGDYSELHFNPSTSTPSTPSRAFKNLKTPSKTPKIRHDETISDEEESDDVKDFRKFSDAKFQKDQQQLQIRHENKPSLKRRRHQNLNPYDSTSSMMAASSRMFQNEEDSIYEHTQYQLMAYGRQVERHDAKRRKRQEERHLEQENRVYQGIKGIHFEEEQDVGKLRAERDQWRREAERYKARCVELEKRVREMKMVQPFPIANTVFPSQAPPPTFLFQATPFGASGTGAAFNFAPNLGGNLNFTSNFNPNFTFSTQAPPPTTTSAAATTTTREGPAPFSLNPEFEAMGPVGPMAPRFPDPVDDSLCFEDDDTSLSDLSNSSKSSEEGGNLN